MRWGKLRRRRPSDWRAPLTNYLRPLLRASVNDLDTFTSKFPEIRCTLHHEHTDSPANRRCELVMFKMKLAPANSVYKHSFSTTQQASKNHEP
jgi:hypothetical protein